MIESRDGSRKVVQSIALLAPCSAIGRSSIAKSTSTTRSALREAKAKFAFARNIKLLSRNFVRNRAIIKLVLRKSRLHILEDAVQNAPNSFLGLISKALHDNYEGVAKEPLPQRWIDLIHHLNHLERVEAERRQSERPSGPRSLR